MARNVLRQNTRHNLFPSWNKMDDIEKHYAKYFKGELTIHQLSNLTTRVVSDSSDRYRVIVKDFWLDLVAKQVLMETSTRPGSQIPPQDFLQMMLHYIRIKREYGE